MEGLIHGGGYFRNFTGGMSSTHGFEPEPHWWEASALTIAPPLLPTVTRLINVEIQLVPVNFPMKITIVIFQKGELLFCICFHQSLVSAMEPVLIMPVSFLFFFFFM